MTITPAPPAHIDDSFGAGTDKPPTARSRRKVRAPIWYRIVLMVMAGWGFLTTWATLTTTVSASVEAGAMAPFTLTVPYFYGELETYVTATAIALGAVGVGFLLAALIGRITLLPFVAGAAASAYFLYESFVPFATYPGVGFGEAVNYTIWGEYPEGVGTYLNVHVVAVALWLLLCVAGIAMWVWRRARGGRDVAESQHVVESPEPDRATDEVPAGWYRDADSESIQRWWDGSDWTDRTRPNVSAGLPADAPTAPAGWYADPHGRPVDRYWTGTSWDDRTRPRVVAGEATAQAHATTTGSGTTTLGASISGLVAARKLASRIDALRSTDEDDQDDEE